MRGWKAASSGARRTQAVPLGAGGFLRVEGAELDVGPPARDRAGQGGRGDHGGRGDGGGDGERHGRRQRGRRRAEGGGRAAAVGAGVAAAGAGGVAAAPAGGGAGAACWRRRSKAGASGPASSWATVLRLRSASAALRGAFEHELVLVRHHHAAGLVRADLERAGIGLDHRHRARAHARDAPDHGAAEGHDARAGRRPPPACAPKPPASPGSAARTEPQCRSPHLLGRRHPHHRQSGADHRRRGRDQSQPRPRRFRLIPLKEPQGRVVATLVPEYMKVFGQVTEKKGDRGGARAPRRRPPRCGARRRGGGSGPARPGRPGRRAARRSSAATAGSPAARRTLRQRAWAYWT